MKIVSGLDLDKVTHVGCFIWVYMEDHQLSGFRLNILIMGCIRWIQPVCTTDHGLHFVQEKY